MASVEVALNYPSLYPLLDRLCPDPDDWQDTFARVQACEQGALKQMHSNR